MFEYAALLLVPFLMVLIIGPFYIRFLQQRYLGQYIREDGPQGHHAKAGTPTMGGLLILIGVLAGLGISYFIVPAYYFSKNLWVILGVAGLLGLLGLIDDYLKISKKHNKGVSGFTKLLVQTAVGLGLGCYMMCTNHISGVAFFNIQWIELGWLYPIFVMLVLNGTSNAVNLTDGLDGLAAGTTIITLVGLSYLLFKTVNPDLVLVSLIFIGAIAGFLVYNRNPARIFMGDVGSLALGGVIAALAVLGQFEFWLLLLGGIFVIEALSVILQVLSFKTTGKRLFKMSPIHHHFELSGWHEVVVVNVFVTVQLLLCLSALFLYNK